MFYSVVKDYRLIRPKVADSPRSGMSTPNRCLHARWGMRTRSCFKGHDIDPAQLHVTAIRCRGDHRVRPSV